MTLHFYLCLHLPLESSTVREGAYYQIMQELICWDEVCFRIRSPNPIIYPVRALANTLSMVKCLIDKYWNKIISSCLRFLPALLPGGKEKLKTENWCQTSSDQLFLHTNKSHDPQILIWIIKYIFARITPVILAELSTHLGRWWAGMCPAFACVETAFVLGLFWVWHFKTAWMVGRWRGFHTDQSCVFFVESDVEVGLKRYFENSNRLYGHFPDPGNFSASNLTWR